MYKKDIDANFIASKKTAIMSNCFKNSLLLTREAKILMKERAYARAHFLIITALEELAKATMLVFLDNTSQTEDFRGLISHKLKAVKIIEIITKYSNQRFTDIDKEKLSFRIVKMREDTLYTRLKPTQEDQFMPDNNYWEKRAIIFYEYLNKYIATISNFLPQN